MYYDIYFRADTEGDLITALPECRTVDSLWINNFVLIGPIVLTPATLTYDESTKSYIVVTPPVMDDRYYAMYRVLTETEAQVFNGRSVTLGAIDVSTGGTLYGTPPDPLPATFLLTTPTPLEEV